MPSCAARCAPGIKKLHCAIGTTIIDVTHDQVEAMTLADRIVILKDGLIEQVGMPDEAYRQPRSVFVGGFVGTPAMNFLKARHRDDDLVLPGAGALPLGSIRHRLGPPGEVVIGIRPEDFTLPADGAPCLQAQVEVVEPLGSDTLVHALAGEAMVTARMKPDLRPKVGDAIRLGFHRDRLHFFDAASGRSLNRNDVPSPIPGQRSCGPSQLSYREDRRP